jgi:serine/threonine protein kinase
MNYNGSAEMDVNLSNFTHLYIVMDLAGHDIECLFSNVPETEISQKHLVIILYNLLCCMNFVHSSNIIHRDISPVNLLIDEECQVRICDFGKARLLPYKTRFEKDLNSFKD